MHRNLYLSNHETQRVLRKHFLQDGYFVYPGFACKEEIARLKNELERFRKERVEKMPQSHVLRGENGFQALKRLYYYDNYFESLVFGSRFEQLASVLLDDQVFGQDVQYVNFGRAEGLPRQDGFNFMISPWEAVTMTLVLDEVDETSGCPHYIKGSHKLGMRDHHFADGREENQEIIDFGTENDRRLEVACPAQAGDLLVHHALTIHHQPVYSPVENNSCLRFVYFADRAMELANNDLYQSQLVAQLNPDVIL